MDFPNVQLLGYSHDSVFLGENLFRYKVTKRITVEGLLLDLANSNGVSLSIYEDLDSLQSDLLGQDYTDITINGQNYGEGRVVGLSFDGDTDVSDKRYTAELEVFSEGDLSSMTGSNYSGVFSGQTGNVKFIQDISENFEYSRTQNGDFSYVHSVDISCVQSSVALSLAKQIANTLKNANSLSGFLGEYGKDIKKLYEEKVNEVTNTYSFVENGIYSGNLQSNYFHTVTRSFTLAENGTVTISQEGEIVGFGANKFASAKNTYTNTILPSSKTSADQIFSTYANPNANERHPLSNVQSSISKSEDPAGGKISYVIQYTNSPSIHQNYLHDYTITKTKNGRFYDVIESGTIKGTGSPSSWFTNAMTALPSILSGAKSRIELELDPFYIASESKRVNEYMGTVSYTLRGTNNPDYSSSSMIKRKSVTISNKRVTNVKVPIGIIGHKEMVQVLGAYPVSEREVSIEILGKYGVSYFGDILPEAQRIVNQNKPNGTGYIDSVDIRYDPFSRNFSLRLIWLFDGGVDKDRIEGGGALT